MDNRQQKAMRLAKFLRSHGAKNVVVHNEIKNHTVYFRDENGTLKKIRVVDSPAVKNLKKEDAPVEWNEKTGSYYDPSLQGDSVPDKFNQADKERKDWTMNNNTIDEDLVSDIDLSTDSQNMTVASKIFEVLVDNEEQISSLVSAKFKQMGCPSRGVNTELITKELMEMMGSYDLVHYIVMSCVKECQK